MTTTVIGTYTPSSSHQHYVDSINELRVAAEKYYDGPACSPEKLGAALDESKGLNPEAIADQVKIAIGLADPGDFHAASPRGPGAPLQDFAQGAVSEGIDKLTTEWFEERQHASDLGIAADAAAQALTEMLDLTRSMCNDAAEAMYSTVTHCAQMVRPMAESWMSLFLDDSIKLLVGLASNSIDETAQFILDCCEALKDSVSECFEELICQIEAVRDLPMCELPEGAHAPCLPACPENTQPPASECETAPETSPAGGTDAQTPPVDKTSKVGGTDAQAVEEGAQNPAPKEAIRTPESAPEVPAETGTTTTTSSAGTITTGTAAAVQETLTGLRGMATQCAGVIGEVTYEVTRTITESVIHGVRDALEGVDLAACDVQQPQPVCDVTAEVEPADSPEELAVEVEAEPCPQPEPQPEVADQPDVIAETDAVSEPEVDKPYKPEKLDTAIQDESGISGEPGEAPIAEPPAPPKQTMVASQMESMTSETAPTGTTVGDADSADSPASGARKAGGW